MDENIRTLTGKVGVDPDGCCRGGLAAETPPVLRPSFRSRTCKESKTSAALVPPTQ
ncbi:unnamed protein product [Ectocarpus sp. 6 AP-2014]